MHGPGEGGGLVVHGPVGVHSLGVHGPGGGAWCRGVHGPGGGGAWSQGVRGPGGPGGDPPDGHCCGRYASYWNAFLLSNIPH